MKKTMITILTCSILLLCVGLSYSYFTGMITGEGKKLKVAATELKILFTDSSSLSNNEIEPGWKESKTFSVKNESDDSFNYNIVFENLVNTFVTEGFLQYKITSSNGYNMEGYLDIPKSSTPTDVVLAYDIDIPVDTTHEYTIEFVYHDSTTVDQSEDMGKVLNGNLAIVEGTVNPNIKYTVTMNSENGIINPTSNETVKKGNLEFEVTPNTGYDVNSMSVSCDPVANTVITGNKIKVNDIRQNHNCEVSFDKETYRVDIVVNNGKSDALNKVVEYGGSGTATITPNYGYTLSGATVSGTGCSIENDILTISNVQSNGTCEVTLPRDKYNVTLAGTGIASSNSPQEAEYEGSTTINFTLSEGYELGDNVINCDNGTPNITGNVLTVSNVTADTTCTLSPVLKSYDVTLKVVGGTPTSETKSVTHNGSTTFNISANTGYTTTNPTITCTGNAIGSLSGSIVTISNITAVQTCTVTLKKQTYTINVSSNNTNYGTVSPTSSTVNHGDSLEVTITEKGGAKYKSNNCGGTVSGNKMTIKNITGTKNCTVTFEYTTGLLADKIKEAYPPVAGRTDFSVIDNGTPKLYTGIDDQGTTYYFSGDGSSMNNWVSFAGKKWRIIRINGNGSVRLLYAGTGGEDGTIGRSSYNSTSNHPANIGWKQTIGKSLDENRGNDSKSAAYANLEIWYTGLENINKNYIDNNAIYCNDRDIASGQSYSTSFEYIASQRLNSSTKSPTFKCSNLNDRFYTFGLMTADEISYAGGLHGTQSPKTYYYLNASGGSSSGIDWWWTMSPYSAGLDGYTSIFRVHGSKDSGTLGRYDVKDAQGYIRPVISIKSCVTVTLGDGSSTNPYELSISTTCSGYDVTANVTNGKIKTSATIKRTQQGGTAEFLIQPNEGYTTSGATVSGTGCTFDGTTGILKASNVTSTRTCSVTLKSLPKLVEAIHTAYGTPTSGRTSFGAIDNGTPKLYKGTDDQGTTYYFSGDGSTMNNWVSFAGSMWRIIRINGNGSIRLLYAGDGNTGSVSNNYNGVGSTGKSAFNSIETDPMYVGWKYGTTGSLANNRTNGNKSTIYGVVATWYNGLGSTNQNYIDTAAIYCNDREIGSGIYNVKSKFYYAAYGRLQSKGTPIFTCSNTSDQFKDGFGLMTADEVVAAGGLYSTNSPKAYYYLNAAGNGSITGDQWWWTMSPSNFVWNSSSSRHVHAFIVFGSGSNPGHLSANPVNNSFVVRPVVSLKSNTLVSGTGTASDPYVVQGLQ